MAPEPLASAATGGAWKAPGGRPCDQAGGAMYGRGNPHYC